MKEPEEGTVPLISVIVPIYNTAQYLRKCLDSLLNQTLKQIEVICIDDGSTDESTSIVEEYETKWGGWYWPRFRVIHTENRGLSAARNRGIDEAKADWLMFVDSDDWVDKDFCRLPYEAAIKHGVDLVIFNRFLTTEKGKIKNEKKRVVQIGRLNPETAIDVGWPAVWNKLYRKILFETIRFPEGQVYEELAIVHKLVYKSKVIIMLQDFLYYYRLRKDGITGTRGNDDAWLETSRKRAEELIQLGYPIEKAKAHLLIVALKCYGRAENANSSVYKNARDILQQVHGIPASFSLIEKMMLSFWKVNRHLYRSAYKMARRS